MRRAALALLALVAVAQGTVVRAHEDSSTHVVEAAPPRFEFAPPAPGTYRLPIIRKAADGEVIDSTGQTRSLREALSGKITLLSFIYTRCTDANGCPLATAVLHKIERMSRDDPALVTHLRLASLSFDPAHDTPEVMAAYHTPARGAEWIDLTTASEAALAPILSAYDVPVQKGIDAAGRPGQVLGHQLRAFLIDREGRVRNIYGLEFLDPRLLLADVRTLLRDEQAAH